MEFVITFLMWIMFFAGFNMKYISSLISKSKPKVGEIKPKVGEIWTLKQEKVCDPFNTQPEYYVKVEDVRLNQEGVPWVKYSFYPPNSEYENIIFTKEESVFIRHYSL